MRIRRFGLIAAFSTFVPALVAGSATACGGVDVHMHLLHLDLGVE
ncbi:MAG TPA: hypothetical protein QF509_01020 [Rhodospirillales bacterium]|jgi:hypothetical protein|nr:hypothetical protein [Rhodospirillales bacterium]